MPILGSGLVSVALLALWLYCVLNVVTTPEYECRNMPKTLWLLITILLPVVGSVLWLIAGRPRRTATRRLSRPRPPSPFPEYERPGRHIARDPAADEEFLRRCRERAEEQRRAAREQRKRDEDQDRPRS